MHQETQSLLLEIASRVQSEAATVDEIEGAWCLVPVV
jgi:hypothetical protein